MSGRQTSNIVHAASTEGHRQAYLDVLTSLFAAEPVSGHLRGPLLKYLIGANRLLISSIDDDVRGFARIALARSLRGRPTAALALRAHSCFGRDVRAKTRYALFASLKRLPRQIMITITPFDIAPHFARVAHAGVCDPQYWDLVGEAPPLPSNTALSLDVRQRAAGRKVCCVLGRLLHTKGLEFLAQILEHSPSLTTDLLLVCAGPVPDPERQLIRRLVAANALVIDRFLTNAEVESLYGGSSAVWACYEPTYDQASGIFGGAMQFGVTAVVRKGSLIERFAAHHGIAVIALEYGDPEQAAAMLKAIPVRRPEEDHTLQSRAALIAGWRRQFITTVEAALEGREPGLPA